MKKKYLALLILLLLVPFTKVNAEEINPIKERLALYKKTATITQIPWFYFAAIDQYERQIREDEPLISISFSGEEWYGISNLSEDSRLAAIGVHNGIGKDGNNDGLAEINNSEDILYTMAMYIMNFGVTDDAIRKALWAFYQKPLAVKTIVQNARIFALFKTNDLPERAFPLPQHFNYSYRSTWGDARGYGGRRIHEGTDIFADYGTPVRATTYATIEIKGWNRYGGWRIGMRDINNVYHYFAHLSGFEQGIEIGEIVKPGDVVGYVGSSGYGPPGTSGKFPPHLHYGMYKDNGKNEWAFDPYPSLRKWERQ
ncbi:Peptidase family M23 [Amphibacillus marinus]|uniref:Peptidase family M23 n=1 Tax=Amphibacillus marinus TaxID=872970 RepID=A0A1H8RZ98_9BACI|nr:M23 family metallopeptidase [Amphibacillus marinus]SEO71606.1 Peptidase family M23 [Amphibacillus marinus]